MFYKPKYLLLTSTIHDHPEIYKTKESYLDVFVKLVKLLPKDGLLVYHKDTVDQFVIDNANVRKISYSLDDKGADYFIKNFFSQEEKTVFEVESKQQRFFLETGMWGGHNLENASASLALCLEMGVNASVVTSAIKSFQGVVTRLEPLGSFAGRILYHDFAQHPFKVKSSLEALRARHLKRKIICVYDPAATALKFPESLAWYYKAFDKADQVIVGKVRFLKKIGKDRVTGKDIILAIAQTQKNVFYQPIDERIIDFLVKNTQKGDVVVFMSSGGLRFANLIGKVIKNFKQL